MKIEKRKVYGTIIGITLFVLVVLGVTYAVFQWVSGTSNDTNLKLTVNKDLEKLIIYKQGDSILSTSNQTLEASETYSGGISTVIEFYKKPTNKTIYGRINMEILNMLSSTDTTDANIKKTDTIKWAITTYTITNATEVLLNEGTFNGKNINDKFPLHQDFELTTTRTFFKIYLWFDLNAIDEEKSVSGELLSTEISAEATDSLGEYNSPNSPDLVQGLIPVKYDESTSTWVKADATNTDNSWYDYSNKLWANAVLVSDTGYDYPKTEKTVNINNNTTTTTGVYTSTNKGIPNSYSDTTFTVTTGSTAGDIIINYSVSSEEDGDLLYMYINDDDAFADGNGYVSGEVSDTYTIAATANTTYEINVLYEKNESIDELEDKATISLSLPSGSTLSMTDNDDYGFSETVVNNIVADAFVYDGTTNKYTLKTISHDTISNNIVGKYICTDITQTSCSTMYKVTTASTAITKVEEYGVPTTRSDVRSTYTNANEGTEIREDDILTFYVWIPRYKYRVWNISKQAGAESTYAYNAKTEGIDIEWETGTESTGTINCTYNHNVDTSNGGVDLSTTTAETCTGSNGDYYTHPAFTFGSDNVKGFWIGKFELTGSSSELTVLPNVNSLRSNTVSSFSTMIQNMQIGSNIYGLSTSRTNTDSHMLTNFEWGAVAYLTNSKYGRCTNGSCTEVTINNCNTYVTGIGANSVSASSSSSTCTTAANKYDGTYGKLASTTGNITGVYDMSGGAWEYTMGNMSSASGSYTFYPSSSGFASSWYTTSTAKYVTTYANGSSYSDQTAYNRGRLGDATGEVVLSTGGTGGWYSDCAYFPYSSYSWFLRGGYYYNSTDAGVFTFGHYDGDYYINNSSRAALVLLSA